MKKRDYQIIEGSLRYIQDRPFKNHSKTHYSPLGRGYLDSRYTWLLRIIGMVWKYCGFRVLR
jgi:hypothetical protein